MTTEVSEISLSEKVCLHQLRLKVTGASQSREKEIVRDTMDSIHRSQPVQDFNKCYQCLQSCKLTMTGGRGKDAVSKSNFSNAEKSFPLYESELRQLERPANGAILNAVSRINSELAGEGAMVEIGGAE